MASRYAAIPGVCRAGSSRSFVDRECHEVHRPRRARPDRRRAGRSGSVTVRVQTRDSNRSGHAGPIFNQNPRSIHLSRGRRASLGIRLAPSSSCIVRLHEESVLARSQDTVARAGSRCACRWLREPRAMRNHLDSRTSTTTPASCSSRTPSPTRARCSACCWSSLATAWRRDRGRRVPASGSRSQAHQGVLVDVGLPDLNGCAVGGRAPQAVRSRAAARRGEWLLGDAEMRQRAHGGCRFDRSLVEPVTLGRLCRTLDSGYDPSPPASCTISTRVTTARIPPTAPAPS